MDFLVDFLVEFLDGGRLDSVRGAPRGGLEVLREGSVHAKLSQTRDPTLRHLPRRVPHLRAPPAHLLRAIISHPRFGGSERHVVGAILLLRRTAAEEFVRLSLDAFALAARELLRVFALVRRVHRLALIVVHVQQTRSRRRRLPRRVGVGVDEEKRKRAALPPRE